MDTDLRKRLGPVRLWAQHRGCRTLADGMRPDHREKRGIRPGGGNQKCGQTTALRSLCTRQENRNDAEMPAAIADALIDRGAHLFVLQGPMPLGPTNTAHVSDSPKAFSIAGCQRSPGIRCHLSSQPWMPSPSSRRANSSTAGLSVLL
jgi:hypothetical protein